MRITLFAYLLTGSAVEEPGRRGKQTEEMPKRFWSVTPLSLCFRAEATTAGQCFDGIEFLRCHCFTTP